MPAAAPTTVSREGAGDSAQADGAGGQSASDPLDEFWGRFGTAAVPPYQPMPGAADPAQAPVASGSPSGLRKRRGIQPVTFLAPASSDDSTAA